MSNTSTTTPKTTKTSKPKAPKTKDSAPAPTPAPTPVPAPTEQVEVPVQQEDAPAPASEEKSTSDMASELYSKLTQLSSVIASLKSEFKALEKVHARDLRTLEKLSSKKHKKRTRALDANGNEVEDLSGFKKPTLISKELATFFGSPVGTTMARTAATKAISKYVKDHGLQRADNKRFIEVTKDKKLQALLKVPSDVELSFFNLQTYMTKHFAKKDDVNFVSAYA